MKQYCLIWLILCSFSGLSLFAQRWSLGGQIGATVTTLAKQNPFMEPDIARSSFGPGYQIDLTGTYQVCPWLHLRAELGFQQLTNGFRSRIAGARPATLYTSRDRWHAPLFIGLDFREIQFDLGWEIAYEFNRFGWSSLDLPASGTSRSTRDWYANPTAAVRLKIDRFVGGMRFYRDNAGGEFFTTFTNENGTAVLQSTTALYGFVFTFGYVLFDGGNKVSPGD